MCWVGNARRVQSSGHMLMTVLVALSLAKAARVLTACLQAPRSSLDLDRAFISKWMTLNWSGKYTGCLLIIGMSSFLASRSSRFDAGCTNLLQRQRELNWPQTHVLAPAALPLTCHVIKMLRSAAQASKAGLPLSTKVSGQKGEKKNSLTYSILSIYTSLYLPSSTYFPLLFNPLWPVPWHY